MLALLDNKPSVFTLRQLLHEFLVHRHEIIYKRTVYDLKKAEMREHILAGFIIALNNIDEVIALIKQSRSAEEAIAHLNKRFLLTLEQGKAILELRLQRLTGMEQEKIYTEMEELKKTIQYYKSILADRTILRTEVKAELIAIKSEYADARRTKIEGPIDILTEADLIPDEEVVVTLTSKGYIKRVPLGTYGVQHRGGSGKMGMTALDESGDLIQDIFVAKTHDELLFFTNLGRVYSLNVFEVPEGSRIAKGRAIVNLLPLAPDETVVKLLPARDLEGKSLVLLTREGIIKRTDAMAFAKIRSSGIRAINLRDNDHLVFCALSSGNDSIVIATAKGQGIRFKETEVRQMGRQASGVMGIRLKSKDFVVGMEVIHDDNDILFATERGYGKRVKADDFRVAHRGGYGVRTIPTTERNGNVIGLTVVTDSSNVLLIDTTGKIIRLSPTEIRTMGRQAQGVRLIRLNEDQRLSAVVSFEEPTVDHEENANAPKAPKNTPIKASGFEDSHFIFIGQEEQNDVPSSDSSKEDDSLDFI